MFERLPRPNFPLKICRFLGDTVTFPKLRGPCQNWGAVNSSRAQGPLTAQLLNVGEGPSILENWLLAPAPQFWKTAPPLKNGQLRGQKHLENAPNFFHSLQTNTKFTFCKKLSKSTNPALSSGPNYLLLLIWGCHHQLDDQHKEPMVNTKII